jgi:hypothetical protein
MQAIKQGGPKAAGVIVDGCSFASKKYVERHVTNVWNVFPKFKQHNNML